MVFSRDSREQSSLRLVEVVCRIQLMAHQLLSLRPSADWMRLTHIIEDNLLSSKSADLNVNVIQRILFQQHPDMFGQISRYHGPRQVDT